MKILWGLTKVGLALVGVFVLFGALVAISSHWRSSAVAAATPVVPACAPRDFTVSVIKWRREYDTDIATIIGTITSNASVACGVQVRFSTYDAQGGLVNTINPWPFSVRNLAPGAKENFSTTMRYDRTAKKLDAEAVDARVW